MLHAWAFNKKIIRIREKVLRIVYSDSKSSFNEILDKDGSISIHQKYLQQH